MSRCRTRVAIAAVSSVLAALAVGSPAPPPRRGRSRSRFCRPTSRGRCDPRRVGRPLVAMGDQHARRRQPGRRCHWRTLRTRSVGPVFFLPGNFGREAVERTCVVAEGTAIYVTPANVECSTVEPPPFFGRTEDELRVCATTGLDEATDFQARVNGQDVADLETYRTSSPLFTLTFPENNVFGVEPGVAQAVSEAYSFIIAPPPPGDTRSLFRRCTTASPSRSPSRSTSSSKRHR